MSEVDVGVDALALYLTGGASNTNPDTSLGGVISSSRARALGAIVTSSIPGLRIDRVFPEIGEGDGTIALDADGLITFTPPDGLPGEAVAIAEGESKIVAGADTSKALRVTREAGYVWNGVMSITFVNAMNAILGMTNISNAERVAGKTTYRCVALVAAARPVAGIRLWLPPVVGAQAVFSLGTEPTSGTPQTIANESTPPSGVTFTSPTSSGSPLHFPPLRAGSSRGLWIRRVFPASGVVAARENVALATIYRSV